MPEHDVLIVGGGPVGLYLASLLEEKLDVLVLDKNTVVGKKADSGLYSTHLSDFIPLQKEWIEHEVDAAVLHSPRGETIELKKPSPAAYVVNREKFTAWLYRRVKDNVALKTTVKEIIIRDTVTLKTNRGAFTSKMLVGCDGASSVVRKHFGVRPKEILNGLIATTKEKNDAKNVDLYFDKNLINDGFFWKIPRGKSTEYGALGKNVNFRNLENLFHIKNYEKKAAFMNTGLFQTAFPRTILAGEAAGQVKPWSLGGIIYGFTCARIAQNVIFEAFEKEDFSEQFLKRYDDRWKKKIGRTISMGMFLRDFFIRMDNQALDSYFRKFRKLKFLSRMDMDFPALSMFG